MFGAWRRQPAAIEVLDLSNELSFTLALLQDPWAWRQRLVEELELGSSDHVRVTSGYQVEFPPPLVEPYVGGTGARRIEILLPLTRREKRLFLDLDLSGPARSPASLLRRSTIATIQTAYLRRLGRSSNAADALTTLPADLLEAICYTTPAAFREFESRERDPDVALAAYLSAGLPLQVTAAQARRWRARQEVPARLLDEVLEEPADFFSSSENMLLALPRMRSRPSSPEEIDALLAGYGEAVAAAGRAGDRVFLAALADYGRRYEMILNLQVPLNEPFSVKLVEQRPLNLSRTGWTTQRFWMRDARSFHLRARVDDHTVDIADSRLRRVDGTVLGIPPLEDRRSTSESLALYTADPDRPDVVDLDLRLRSTRDVRLTLGFVAAIAWVTVAATLVIPRDDSFVEALGVLTVPTTFAIAFVLLRDETSLAARLTRAGKIVLFIAVGLLWSTTLVRLLL